MRKLSRLLTFIVVAVVAFAMSAPVNVSAEGGNRQILFYSDRDGDNDIYVIKENGQLKQLTENTATQEEKPSWRPQGDSFVFISYVAFGSVPQLYSMSMPNEHITQLTNDPNFAHDDPSYSPDGSQIVFVSRDVTRQSCIKVLTVATLEQTTLFCSEGREGFELPVYSPDGDQIMYTRFAGEVDRYVYDLATETSSLLIPGAYTGVWSPDGSQIAFSRLRGPGVDTEQVFLANADGSNEQQITTSSPEDPDRSRRAVAWYPDGLSLLTISYGDPDFLPEIRSLRLSDLQEETLAPHILDTSDFATAGAVRQ